MNQRVVLDTNVLISGLLWRGNPYKCLYLAQVGVIQSVTCAEILEEFQRKLQDKFLFSLRKARQAIAGVKSYSLTVKIQGTLSGIVPDPDDDRFVECAQVAEVASIISGDKHLLELKTYRQIAIVNPSAFLSLIGHRK